MIHEKFADMFSANNKISQDKQLLVEKSTKVIVISESTKKDLIKIFGTDESKIEVVYLGNSMIPELKADIKLKIPNRYVLFVGSRGGYKNFERFIKSISSILNKDKNLCVICAGGGKFNFKELEIFSGLNIANQITQYNLDDATLANLYQNAQLFVFPSLYEGFGIPILESFACQCPLLCSNTSSLPEIAGDGAYYFDPYSEESMRHSIIKVLEDKYLQDKLRQKGTVRLKQFSWKKAAIETRKIYKSVMK
jgi:glycosyltransferase involved in cell wall biosynthesis